MAQNKEFATERIRIHPTVHRQLKIIGAKTGRTIGEVIRDLLKTNAQKN